MTIKIQTAISEAIVDEKIYMVEKEWAAVRKMLDTGCLKQAFMGRCDVLYSMLCRIIGETEEQVQKIKTLGEEIADVCLINTGWDIR